MTETGRGGGIRNVSATSELVNTIIAENTAATGPDCSGLSTSLDYNLIGDDINCGFAPVIGDLVNVAPLLGPLRDNGGPTFTHALLPGSPAVDAGDDNAAPATDQRGVIRPQGEAGDIGAYEVCVPSEPPRPGDANRDCFVDTADLIFVLMNWGTPTDIRADLNGDGVVDIRDLVLVAINM